jgi:hypothetical protein
MPRSTIFLLALATLSVPVAIASAQTANLADSGNTPPAQYQPAPIERSAPGQNFAPNGRMPLPARHAPSIKNSQPAQGVLVRYENQNVQTVAVDPTRTEVRVTHGIANVDVHNPEQKKLILVDLPGGQTQLLKNGLYTFNADTNTVRVLHGEANAFPGTTTEKPIKVKENHQVAFVGTHIRSTDFDDYQAGADLLPPPNDPDPYPAGGYGALAYDGGGYGPAFDDGYGDPYFAWGYPFGWGLGYGWGGWGGYGPFWGGRYFYRGGRGYGGHGYGGYHGGVSNGFHGGSSFGGGGFHGGGGGGGFHGGGGGGGHR